MGCNSRCNFKQGKDYCANPERRTYSLESTGVDVEKTLEDHFSITLEWYNRENYDDIKYMVKAIGLFYNDNVLNEVIDNDFISHLNSLKSTKYQIGSRIYEEKLKEFRK